MKGCGTSIRSPVGGNGIDNENKGEVETNVVVIDSSVASDQQQSILHNPIEEERHADVDGSMVEVRDQMGAPSQRIIEFDSSPLPPSSTSILQQQRRQRGDESSLEERGELSLYEAVDVACSPLNCVESSQSRNSPIIQQQEQQQQHDLSGGSNADSFQSAQSSHNRENESGIRQSMASVNEPSVGSKSREPRSLSSFIVDDENDDNQQQQPRKEQTYGEQFSFLKPRIVQDLGKGYRTPPVSPVVSLLMKESACLARGSSTPRKEIDDVKSRIFIEEQGLSGLSLVEENAADTATSVLDDGDDVNGDSGRDISYTSVPPPPQCDEFLSDDDNDASVTPDQISLHHSRTQQQLSERDHSSLQCHGSQNNSTRNLTRDQTTSERTSNNQSDNNVDITANKSHLTRDTSTAAAIENTNLSCSNESAEHSDNDGNEDTADDGGNSDVHVTNENAISIHISEESSASLYDVCDMSCSPMKDCDIIESSPVKDCGINESSPVKDCDINESSASIYEARDVSCSPINNRNLSKSGFVNNSNNSDIHDYVVDSKTNKKIKSCDLETSQVDESMLQNECTTDASSTSDDENRDDTDNVSAPRRDVLGEISISAGSCDNDDVSLAMTSSHRCPPDNESNFSSPNDDDDDDHHANSSVFSSNHSKNNSVGERIDADLHISRELNYTRLGDSPTTTSVRPHSVTSATSSRRRSKAATFFDQSLTSDEEERRKSEVKVELGESQFADTQPINKSDYNDSFESQRMSLKSATSVVLEDGTQDNDGSTTEDDQFDLDRLKSCEREEEEKKKLDLERDVVIDESMNVDQINNNNDNMKNGKTFVLDNSKTHDKTQTLNNLNRFSYSILIFTNTITRTFPRYLAYSSFSH